MAKNVRLRIGDVEELNRLGKALSSPVGVRILQLLNSGKLTISQISQSMGIPPSSAALDIKILQNAGLVTVEEQPGSRGNAKICARFVDMVNIRFTKADTDVDSVLTVEMPVGNYPSCEVKPPCGLANEQCILEMDDTEQSFYMPERTTAQILWSSRGYVEYTFPNRLRGMPYKCIPQSLSVSAEVCSEVLGYSEDWKSDITLWINGLECGTWTSPGDFGKRRGKITPPTWSAGRTQYGLLTIWEIGSDGCYINHQKVGSRTVEDLKIMDKNTILVRIGVKDDAVHKGGFNIFGKKFGDYGQDIIMSIAYSERA